LRRKKAVVAEFKKRGWEVPKTIGEIK